MRNEKPVTPIRVFICSVCKGSGGTMIKYHENGYIHQDPRMCDATRKRNILFGRKIKIKL